MREVYIDDGHRGHGHRPDDQLALAIARGIERSPRARLTVEGGHSVDTDLPSGGRGSLRARRPSSAVAARRFSRTGSECPNTALEAPVLRRRRTKSSLPERRRARISVRASSRSRPPRTGTTQRRLGDRGHRWRYAHRGPCGRRGARRSLRACLGSGAVSETETATDAIHRPKRAPQCSRPYEPTRLDPRRSRQEQAPPAA